ncbi:MAG: phosphoribosyltransferase [Candidatus Njordarchaeia archaeon]
MGLTFKVITWDETISMSMRLGKKILESGYNPDYLVGIARGGLVPLRILSDLFKNTNVLIVNVKLYRDIGERSEEVTFVQKVDIDLEGQKVLLVDDVADTGLTIKAVVDYIKENKKVKEVKIATLHYKPWSVIKPDYYMEEVTDWIVYPWEYIESLKPISEKVQDDSLSGEERRNAEEAIKIIKEQLMKYNGL